MDGMNKLISGLVLLIVGIVVISASIFLLI